MLRTIYFDNQLCRSAVKIHDKSANNPLFVNLHRVFAEKKIPELALMGRHFPAKPSGIFQLAVIFWYGHIFYPLSRLRRQLSQRESQVPNPTHYTERCIEVRSYCSSNWDLNKSIMLLLDIFYKSNLPFFIVVAHCSIK